ncbi:hydrogenase subunit MbhD domain-containing protein [Falsiroseomonas oryziterrae]|uniref:hydrogenase subunit MbhD domain-containing protein n=1 Tax=Falsiroseomonas oryziterrae TaxID=2911368 RepID=UPI001F3829FD|nr:hydrogenase subunit MbhD domain-containing protein [Roseomonas sp. NPKOSM-4]
MTAGLLFDLMMALAVLGTAAWTLAARTQFAAVIGFVATGLLLSLVWVRLGAVDVALTEAAIGAGATGVIILYVVARLRGGTAEISAATPSRAQRALAALLAVAVGGVLALAVLNLPDPAPSLAEAALAGSAPLGLGNPVSAVLMAHRGLDTLLESVVLVFAVLAVWSMAADHRWGGAPGPVFRREESGPLSLLARVLPPVGIVVGIYIAWVGADAPGGKFQGGTILAAMWILPWIAGLARPPSITDWRLRLMIAAGPLTFLCVGLAGFAVADGFLSYPPSFAKPLILLIEAAMTLSVAAALACLIAGPPERRLPPESMAADRR